MWLIQSKYLLKIMIEVRGYKDEPNVSDLWAISVLPIGFFFFFGLFLEKMRVQWNNQDF